MLRDIIYRSVSPSVDRTDRWADGRAGGRTDERAEALAGGRPGGRADGQGDGRTSGRMDVGADGQTGVSCSGCVQAHASSHLQNTLLEKFKMSADHQRHDMNDNTCHAPAPKCYLA